MIYRFIDGRGRRRHISKGGTAAPLTFLGLTLALILVPLAGCSPQGMAQSATATANAQATQVASLSPTVATPTLSLTSTVLLTPAQVTISASVTAGITATGVVTPSGTEGPRPTPEGPPPNPIDVLNIFQFFSPESTLVARDLINLDGAGTDEILFTVSGSVVLTQEARSAVGVLRYDPTYREWTPLWGSGALQGVTSPLPSANRREAGGYNGGNILGNTGPIIAARTTTLDGKAHLYLWRWNKDKAGGEALKMARPEGGEADAVFTADLDATMADIDDDGIYEVVLDNVASVQVWRWDGARFVPRGER